MLASERRQKLIAETQPFIASEVDKAPELTEIILASEGQGIKFRCCDWLPLSQVERTSRFGFTFYGLEALPVIVIYNKIFSNIQELRNTVLQEVIHAFAQSVNDSDEPSEDGGSIEYGLAQIRALVGAALMGGVTRLLSTGTVQANLASAARWDVHLEERGVDRKSIQHARDQGEYCSQILLVTMRPESPQGTVKPLKPLR